MAETTTGDITNIFKASCIVHCFFIITVKNNKKVLFEKIAMEIQLETTDIGLIILVKNLKR